MNKLFKIFLIIAFFLTLYPNDKLFSERQLSSKNKSNLANPTFWQWNQPSGSYRVYFQERGAGDRHVLLIHGFGGHTFTWRYLMDQLANAGFHVWSLDLLGFGYSDKPANVQYGLDLFIAQIDAFMEAKSIASAEIVGNSMGGGLALGMAIKHPARANSLVLIDPLAFPVKLPYYYAITKIFGKLTFPFFGRTMVKIALRDMMYDRKKISEEQMTAYSLPFLMTGGKEAYLKILQNADTRELDQLSRHYHKITVPLLIIWGKEDRLIPRIHQQHIAHQCPQAQTLTISNCGHIPQEESPQEVLQGILDFYKLGEINQ